MLAAPLVDEPATGRPQEPGARLRGDALAWPVVGGRDQRLLDGVLGRVEVGRAAGQGAENLRRERAQQVLDARRVAQRVEPLAVSRNASISPTFDGASFMTWRTMIGCSIDRPPGPGTAEYLAAISIARASDSTSTIW